jgi:hypothetical protein
MKAACGGCSKEWGGIRAAHCSGCHKTFVSPNAFDLHQSLKRLGALCLEPATVGLVYDKVKDLYRFMNPDEEKDSDDLRTVQGQEPRRM